MTNSTCRKAGAVTPDHYRAFILATLAGADVPMHIEPGRWYRFSTNGKRSDVSGWCLLFEDCRAGIFGDWRTGLSSVWTAQRQDRMTPAERARLSAQVAEAKRKRDAEQRQQHGKNGERIAKLWGEARPVVASDPVHRYLCDRLRVTSLALPSADVMRFHPALAYRHESGRVTTHPGMVCAMHSLAGRVVTLHRTFLSSDGRKADVPTVKRLMPTAGPLAGAAIRLAMPDVEGRIGIAEGVETALSFSLASGLKSGEPLPVQAAYSAHGLACWQWPQGTKKVFIAGDNDDAGRRAADELRVRALRAGLRVVKVIPSIEGADWCDVWASREVA